MSLLIKTNKLSNIVKFSADYYYQKNINKLSNKQIGKWTKNKLSDMGPTFIKIGQFISTRSDVFGEEFTNELKQLQDNVKAISFEKLSSTFDKYKLNFEYIKSEPLASASIGQVHLAKLLTGEDVVIKIKRPNISVDINEDFGLLLALIKFLKFFSDDRKLTEFEILFTEYYNLLNEEIDFNREMNNMKIFQKIFSTYKQYIKVPKVYEEFSNNDIITMEYVPTIKINDVDTLQKLNFNCELISNKLIECYVNQIIEHGYVHIDPHPGNLGITKKGKIVFYDYGMILNLDNKIKENFNSLLIAIYDKDVDMIANIALDMELIVIENKNMPYFKSFLLSFLTYIENLDIEDFKVSYIDKVDQSNMPFLISSKFLLLLRGLSILEGICKKLDPNFNYKKTLDPYISNYLVDVKYLENRAIADFDMIKIMPDKVSQHNIKIDILEKSIIEMEKTITRKNDHRSYFIYTFIFSLLLQFEYDIGIPTYILFVGIFYMLR
jgi:predicted unusual protein kinase regulating ubiquinone biosynthesis (AarF/ABC1/UbiB family)